MLIETTRLDQTLKPLNLICKVGPFSVKHSKTCLLIYKNPLVMTSAILFTNLQPCTLSRCMFLSEILSISKQYTFLRNQSVFVSALNLIYKNPLVLTSKIHFITAIDLFTEVQIKYQINTHLEESNQYTS